MGFLEAYRPGNVTIIRQLLDDFKCVYTFEFYDQGRIVEQGESPKI